MTIRSGRLPFRQRRQDVGEIGLAGQRHRRRGEAEPLGPEPHLGGRLLAREIERAPSRRGEGRRELQQQRRLADAGLAADQQCRARHDAAAGDAVELRHAGRRCAVAPRRGRRAFRARRRGPRVALRDAGAGRPGPHQSPRRSCSTRRTPGTFRPSACETAPQFWQTNEDFDGLAMGGINADSGDRREPTSDQSVHDTSASAPQRPVRAVPRDCRATIRLGWLSAIARRVSTALGQCKLRAQMDADRLASVANVKPFGHDPANVRNSAIVRPASRWFRVWMLMTKDWQIRWICAGATCGAARSLPRSPAAAAAGSAAPRGPVARMPFSECRPLAALRPVAARRLPPGRP